MTVRQRTVLRFAIDASTRRCSWVEHCSTLRWLGHSGESRNAGVGRSPTHGGCSQRRRIQWRGPFVGRALLYAARAWAQRRIQERGRRAKPDPRGLFSAPDDPVARSLRGSSSARRGEGLGTATNPGTRASGEARPTGVLFSVADSSGECPSWVEHCSTRRWLGHSGESRNAGVGRSPTHGGLFSAPEDPAARSLRGSSSARRCEGLGRAANPGTRASGGARPTGGCSRRRRIQWRGPFVGRASLDAASAWAQRRIQERGRRAKPDPRGLFSASRTPAANALRGSSTARRGVGLGTAANPGTRASGGARPTRGCSRRRGIQWRGPFVGRAMLDAARAWAPRRIQERGRRAKPDPRGVFSAPEDPVARSLRGSSIARRDAGLGTSANP